jgi:hypothetical protein
MAILLEAYPKLTKEMITKIGYNSASYRFFYRNRGEEHTLKSETADNSTSKEAVFKLSDPECQWHPEINDLLIDCKCVINVPSFLFGAKGLVNVNGGELGVGVVWMAPDSSVRGVVPIGRISSDSKAPVLVDGRLCFNSGILRGMLTLQLILYIAKGGVPSNGEDCHATIEGTTLGILDESRVIIDGNGSLFPVHEVNAPEEPLWYVTQTWENPLEDGFTDENFCIYLNTAHKDYASLHVDEGLRNSPMLMEIICSALQMLISSVLDDPLYRNDTENGNNISPGSISSVVNYYLRACEWKYDPEHPESLAIQIRKTLTSKMA